MMLDLEYLTDKSGKLKAKTNETFNGNINKHTIFKLDQTDHCYGNILPDKCLSSKSHFFCHLTVAYVLFCSFIRRITPKICM